MTLSGHEALVDLAWAVGGFAVPWTLYRGAVNLYRWRGAKEGERVTVFPAPADDRRLGRLAADPERYFREQDEKRKGRS